MEARAAADIPSGMELRHFRCVAALAARLHFARAAAHLGISPPALTKQIQEIERALGVRLFERTKRSVALTSAGAAFLVEAQRTLRQAARAEEAARRAGRGEIGRIEIGYVASAAYAGLLQTHIAAFRRSHPLVLLNLSELAMAQLPQRIEGGGLDLAYVRPPLQLPEGVTARTLIKERFVVALPEQAALATSASTRGLLPAALASQRFILPEQASGTEEVARRGRFTAQIAGTPGGLVAVITQVSLGVGIAVVPASVIGRIAMPGVVYREIEGRQIATGIALASRRHEKSPVVEAYLKQVSDADAHACDPPAHIYPT